MGEVLIRLIIYLCRFTWVSITNIGRASWQLVEAVVTDDPVRVNDLMHNSVEFPYSYRIKGELYTGLHEEPCYYSESEYMERFSKGRRFVARVKPGEPEVSIVREKDQGDSIEKVLGR